MKAFYETGQLVALSQDNVLNLRIPSGGISLSSREALELAHAILGQFHPLKVFFGQRDGQK